MSELKVNPIAVAEAEINRFGVLSLFNSIMGHIRVVYDLIQLFKNYGTIKVEFSNIPQGRLIRKIDIPIINVYCNISAEVSGVWVFVGHFWF